LHRATLKTQLEATIKPLSPYIPVGIAIQIVAAAVMNRLSSVIRISMSASGHFRRPARAPGGSGPASIADISRRRSELPGWADFVAKRFCTSERATLIQDRAPMRNVDSKILSARFDSCEFLFAGSSSPTFAAESVECGPGAPAGITSAFVL